MSTFHCIYQPIHTRLIPSSLSVYLFLSFSRNAQVVNYKLLPFQTTLMSFLPRCRENIAIHLHLYHTYEKNSHSLPIFLVSRIIAFVQMRLVSVRFCLVYFFRVFCCNDIVFPYIHFGCGMCSSVFCFSLCLLIMFYHVNTQNSNYFCPEWNHEATQKQQNVTNERWHWISSPIQWASLIGAKKIEHNTTTKRLSVCWVITF